MQKGAAASNAVQQPLFIILFSVLRVIQMLAPFACQCGAQLQQCKAQDAAAIKTEEKAPKAKKSRAAKPKKPSIRAQLDAAKKEQSKQTPPREKTKELEV